MQLCWRQVAPRETDHELLWLSISLAALASAAVWFAAGLPWPRCIFLAVTGHPCVTCGATRAALQFFHGNFLVALKWNPLAFAGLCAVLVFDVYAVLVLVTHAPRLRIAQMKSTEKRFVRLSVLVALALNWIYLLFNWRNLS